MSPHLTLLWLNSRKDADLTARRLFAGFFLLALFASIFLRRTYALLSPGHQELLEPIVYNYLLCLAIADWTVSLGL